MMRIVKEKISGLTGTTILGGSTVERLRTLEDEYCVVLRASGLTGCGDPVSYRIILTRNELALLNQL